MTNDLFKGVDVDDSRMMLEFMSEMKQESKKLKLETLRLEHERRQLQISLETLSQLETMLQLRKDDRDINDQFLMYVR